MPDLTRSAEKREFYKRLEGIGQIDDSEDEAAIEAESFLKDARPGKPARSRSRRSQQPSHSAPAVSDLKSQPQIPAVTDSTSETQSDASSVGRIKRTKSGSKQQPQAVAVEDLTSETDTDSEPARAVKRKNNNLERKSRSSIAAAVRIDNGSSSSPPTKFRRVLTAPNRASRRVVHSEFQPPALRHSASAPITGRKVSHVKRSGGRRKLEEAIIPKPPIFNGAKFFFVPNDDRNPARKNRIERLQEWGGIRISEWSLDVDFVTLEDGLTYQDLMDWLKVEKLPSNTAIVNHKFIPDCIIHQVLLPAMELGYQVRGSPLLKESIKVQPTTKSAPQASTVQLIKQEGTRMKRIVQSYKNLSDSFENSRNRKASPPALLRHQSAPQATGTDVYENIVIRDELAEAIEEARDLEYLSFNDSQDGFGNDIEASLASLPYEDTRDWQKNFACMHAGSEEKAKINPNARTIDILNKMGHYYDAMGDQFRSLAYRKAVTTLKKEYRLIIDIKDAKALPNVGPSIAEKIVEITLTHRLRKLDALMDDPRSHILQQFTQIYGVGMMQACRWVGTGYRTLDDIRTQAKLSDNQKVGLDHYDDFLERIPRDVVKQHGDFVLQELRKLDSAYEITIGGSYRRGKADSGDIDIIITKPGAKRKEICELITNRFIPHMEAIGFLTVRLSGSDYGDKWQGCSCYPGTTIWRRIDFLLVPWDEIGAALIYFTGNDIFNRSIRLLASKKKMCLNQHGLFGDVIRKRHREKLNEGRLLESKSEKRIFEILGVPWRPAEDRNL